MFTSAFGRRTVACTLVAGIALSGCATASKDITSTYVSPTQYATYDCGQLSAEATRLQTRYAQLGGRLDEAASNDKMITGVGIVLFWPALFALGGTKQQEAEYARLKGEYDAVQQTAIQKKCDAWVGGSALAAPPAAAAASGVAPAGAPAASSASI